MRPGPPMHGLHRGPMMAAVPPLTWLPPRKPPHCACAPRNRPTAPAPFRSHHTAPASIGHHPTAPAPIVRHPTAPAPERLLPQASLMAKPPTAPVSSRESSPEECPLEHPGSACALSHLLPCVLSTNLPGNVGSFHRLLLLRCSKSRPCMHPSALQTF